MSEQRPVGETLERLPSGRRPERKPLEGRSVRLEPVDVAAHGGALYAAFAESDPEGAIWIGAPSLARTSSSERPARALNRGRSRSAR